MASDVAAITEAVRHEVSALLVPANDADGLATALARVLDDPPLAARLGAAARSRVECDYALSRQTRELEACYDTLLPGRGREAVLHGG